MKPDIHPDVRRDHGHLHLRQHLHHAQHRQGRRHPRRRVLGLPPVLHGQAEDPRHRRPRRQVRAAVRQEAASRTASSRRRSGDGAVRRSRSRSAARPPSSASRKRPPCSRTSPRSSTSTPTSNAQLADPAIHADQGAARRLGRRYAELGADRRRLPRVAVHRRRHRGRRASSPPRTPAFAAELVTLQAAPRRAHRAAPAPARPARPGRRPGRHPRDQGGRGRRRVGAVRRRTCCGCTCATPSAAAGRPRSWTRRSPTSAGTRTSRSR